MRQLWYELHAKQTDAFDIQYATSAQIDEHDGAGRLRFMGQFTARSEWEKPGVWGRIVWNPDTENLRAFYALPNKLRSVVMGLGVISHKVMPSSNGFDIVAAEVRAGLGSALVLGTLAADASNGRIDGVQSEFPAHSFSEDFIMDEYLNQIVARSIHKRLDMSAKAA